MSVPITLGSFTSKGDYQRKYNDYMKLLKLQSNLNAEGEKASVLTQLYYDNEVNPPPGQFVATEDELAQENQQREIALQNLKEKMKPSEATNFISKYLGDLEELNLFNQYWGDFKEEIKGVKFISADFMNNLWDRYTKALYAGTSEVASITQQQSELDRVGRDLKVELEGQSRTPVDFAEKEKQIDDAVRRFDVAKLGQLKREIVDRGRVREEVRARANQRVGQIRNSAWSAHLRAVREEYPDLPYRQQQRIASETYQR